MLGYFQKGDGAGGGRVDGCACCGAGRCKCEPTKFCTQGMKCFACCPCVNCAAWRKLQQHLRGVR